MAVCKKCKHNPRLMGGPDQKKCIVCQEELEYPANQVCKACSNEFVVCEYCGQSLGQNNWSGIWVPIVLLVALVLLSLFFAIMKGYIK